MLLEECPVVFLDVPGLGELHLLDVRAFQGTTSRGLALERWQIFREYYGVVYAHCLADFADLTIPGPLGWTFDDMIMPSVDVIADIAGVYSRSMASVPEDGCACSVYLHTDFRDDLMTYPLDTPSVLYKDGCMKLRF